MSDRFADKTVMITGSVGGLGHPGIIDTPLAYDPKTGAELVPTGDFAIPRMASVEEIMKYVLFVASEDASFSTGSEFVADGGFALGPIAPAKT